jgi:hypothetical protein
MQQSQGGLISFNNFILISTKLTVSETLTSISMGTPDTAPILLLIIIDQPVTTMP